MVNIPIMTTSGATLIKAGADVNTAVMSGANIVQFINDAEALVNSLTRINYSDSFSGLNTDVQGLLSEASSNLAAMYVINYDINNYQTPEVARTMLDVLRDGAMRAISLLRDKNTTDFIDGA
jgi:hypothetical protein|tara:strand:+ start:1375 stop:1740 length:366 start_codon:yes stop_codon:yes gene_type:complete